MKKLLFALLLAGAAFQNLSAQSSPRTTSDQFHAWFSYSGDHKISPKWGLHLEAQVRRADGLAAAQQLLLRPGVNYHFSPTAFASAGYCFVETWPYGDFAAKSRFPENRFWEQIQVKNAVGRVEIVNRLRVEQRFVKSPVQGPTDAWAPGDAVFSNRFRVLNRFSMPLKGKAIGDRSFYVTAFDEIFVSAGKHVAFNLFDQNRAFVGLGYRFPTIGRLEAGFLNQFILKSDGMKAENNRTILVALNSNLDFFKPKS